MKAKSNLPIFEFYILRNKKGEFYRSKGRDGYGLNWVTEPKKARVFTKPGPAKAVLTWWNNHTKLEGEVELVKIAATSFEVVKVDYKKIKLDKLKKELKRRKWDKNYHWNYINNPNNCNSFNCERYKEAVAEVERLEKEIQELSKSC